MESMVEGEEVRKTGPQCLDVQGFLAGGVGHAETAAQVDLFETKAMLPLQPDRQVQHHGVGGQELSRVPLVAGGEDVEATDAHVL